jgi:RES domain-containing protein
MEVYRITLSKWAGILSASGFPGRWNSKGTYVTYSSGSRALASLENIVHRSGEGLNNLFKVTVFEIPDYLDVEEIRIMELPDNWFEFKNYGLCQKLGDKRIQRNKTAILKVPSAIIKKEYNYLINPNHLLFETIRINRVEDFAFDPRIKES